MADNYAPELGFAVEQARRAGELLMASYEQVLRVDYKSKRDVVTDVDIASENLLIEAVQDRYPADAILAEESGHHERKDQTTDSVSGRTWVMDPLDGTVNYANGIPFFCVSIALIDQGRPAVGVIFDPARGDLLTATSGGLACLAEEPIEASRKSELSDFVVSLAVIGPGGIARERRLSKAIRIPRRMGSAALSLAYVGSGRFDAFVQNGGLSPWDVAAAGLIAERGGAVVTDLHGEPWWNETLAGARTSIVAAPHPHHGKLLEMLAESRTRVRSRR